MHVHNRLKHCLLTQAIAKCQNLLYTKNEHCVVKLCFMNEALYMLRPHDPRPVTTEKVLSCKYPLDSGTFNLKRAMKPSP